MVALLQIRTAFVAFLVASLLFNVYLFVRLQSQQVTNLHGRYQVGGVLSPELRKRIDQSTPLKDTQTTKPSLLSCQAYGGPLDHEAAEMVYWRADIPDSKSFHSSYFNSSRSNHAKYLVFQTDEAGFSNVRLGFETVVALAKATGRTLVLPPKSRFSLLAAGFPIIPSYDFTDFFDISGLSTISFRVFLERKAMIGELRDNTNGTISFPPDDRTDWDELIGNSGSAGLGQGQRLWEWIQSVTTNLDWKRDDCFVAFTGNTNNHSDAAIYADFASIISDDAEKKITYETRVSQYNGNPVPVDAKPRERLREMLAARRRMCSYNETLAKADVLFISGLEQSGARPLLPFYSYFYFDDWHQDLQMKRFIRDHLRFADHIQCAAARIVAAVRRKSRQNGDNRGGFDSMHIRRTDFETLPAYRDGLLEAQKIVDEQYITEGRTVYIATDEKDMNFFHAMHEHHYLLFLGDFLHLLKGIDPNFYGMIEQLVIARGDKFVGTYYSTFTAYVNRIRGYFVLKNKLPGHLEGALNSEHLGHKGHYRYILNRYKAVNKGPWTREWPVAWRDMDHDIDNNEQ